MAQITIEPVANHPGIHETVAQWLWSEWGNPHNQGLFRSLVAHCRGDGIPALFAAFSGGRPVGVVGLFRADLVSRQDLTPWMGTLYVIPEYRRKGIALALEEYALDRAKELGFPEVFLYTRLTGYYERRGWVFLDRDEDDLGNRVSIYRKIIR